MIAERKRSLTEPMPLRAGAEVAPEVFQDIANILCPANMQEIDDKVRKLKSYKILQGTRGKGAGDIAGYVAMIERVTHLFHQFPSIRELDINPVRILADGSGVVALDARIRIEA